MSKNEEKFLDVVCPKCGQKAGKSCLSQQMGAIHISYVSPHRERRQRHLELVEKPETKKNDKPRKKKAKKKKNVLLDWIDNYES